MRLPIDPDAPNPDGRLIVIGDVHGCATELDALLRRLALQQSDRLVLLGDLVNRGPDSHGVLEIARQHRAISLLGNHEARLLRHQLTGIATGLKSYDYPTLHQLTAEDWQYLRRMRLHYATPDEALVCVHGGFLPQTHWKVQPVSVVTRIQVIDAQGRPQRRGDCPKGRPWAEFWDGPPFVVYGHTPALRVQRHRAALGIDTGVVHGGKLTAFIWPTGEIVQEPARRAYWPRPLWDEERQRPVPPEFFEHLGGSGLA